MKESLQFKGDFCLNSAAEGHAIFMRSPSVSFVNATWSKNGQEAGNLKLNKFVWECQD